jgi:hypothetical protein
MTKFRSALLPTLLLATPVFAATTMTGVWSVDITWNDSTSHNHPVCTLSVTDQKVSGSCKDERGIVIPIVSGNASENRVTWEIHGTENGESHSTKFAAAVASSGDGLTGTVDFDGRMGTFVAKRE